MKRSPNSRAGRARARVGRQFAVMLCAAAMLTCGAPAAWAQAEFSGNVGVAELSPQAELAIDRGLAWLADQQKPDGSWGGGEDVAGITSVALMAFMLKGYFPERGQYGDKLAKAVDFLIRRGTEGGGYFGGKMYSQGLATLALSEVWGMSSRPELRDTLKRAVDVIIRAQHSSGGWRYTPLPVAEDLSVTVMVLVALVSAQEAGILVPKEVIDRSVRYVERCQNDSGGFRYMLRAGDEAFARSAAGTMALHLLGHGDEPAARQGLAYLKRAGDGVFKSVNFYYYAHYYAVNAMYQAGEEHYDPWYAKIRDGLLNKQRKDGSWSGGRGGTEYSTGMAILVLGVPYRFLPIYQR